MTVRRVRVPPAEPVPPGHCSMCRQPLADHTACPYCHGSGEALVKRVFDPTYPPCHVCDGYGKNCPLPQKGAMSTD